MWNPVQLTPKQFKEISRDIKHEIMHGPDIPYQELWEMMEKLCKHIVYLDNALRNLHGTVEIVNVEKDSI